MAIDDGNQKVFAKTLHQLHQTGPGWAIFRQYLLSKASLNYGDLKARLYHRNKCVFRFVANYQIAL